MKKILLFVIGMLCFIGVVNADIYPRAELSFSKEVISVGEQVYYVFNDFMNNTGSYTIKYNEEYLEYNEYFCFVDGGNYDIDVECDTKCEVDTPKSGELIFTCDNKLKSEELLHVHFKTIKSTDGEETTIYETFDENFTSRSFEIVDINKTKDDKNEPTDAIACKEDAETSNLEILTEPFVLGIISGFSIVIIILSVMLSKKTKKLKNTKNEN